MLPGSTPQRKERKTDGRATEIQRFIGRALRAVARMEYLGENTVWIDCDVLQADGGTRTAAITGAYVAVCDAVADGRRRGLVTGAVLPDSVAAVSVGVVNGRPMLDLDYSEDSTAEVDMNVAMTGSGRFIEVQGTAERRPFTPAELTALLSLARRGCRELTRLQQAALRSRRPVKQGRS
jgi:ribonuclease PH